MKVEILQVAGFRPAVQALRLPLDSGGKSDTDLADPDETSIGSADLKLSSKLIRMGSGHRKFIRLVDAWLKITAPRYWWAEFDTYRYGVDKVSGSTMHTLLSKPITMDLFACGVADHIPLDTLKKLEDLRTAEGIPANCRLYQMKKILPESFLQTRIVKCSYEALRKMYQERKDHRLPEWRIFCSALHDLPHSDFITYPELSTLDGYAEAAMRTCSICHDDKSKLMHGVFGLNSEAGEVAGILQKTYQGHELDPRHMIRELGDTLWMQAEACDALGVKLSAVALQNIEKLEARYPHGFDPERSLHRAEGDI